MCENIVCYFPCCTHGGVTVIEWWDDVVREDAGDKLKRASIDRCVSEDKVQEEWIDICEFKDMYVRL